MRWKQILCFVSWASLTLVACTSGERSEPEIDSADEPDEKPSDPSQGKRDSSERASHLDSGANVDARTRSDAHQGGALAMDANRPPAADATADGAARAQERADGGSTQRCSGKLGARRGKSNHTIMSGGALRSFIHYAPAELEPDEPAPLVIVPHGSLMSGQMMYDITQYAALADRERIVAIFPDGIDGPGSFTPWNIGEGTCGLGALVPGAGDDLTFVRDLIEFAAQDQCIDRDHVFVTGFSMGGYFAHHIACSTTEIRAIAPHSAGTHDLSACPAPARPVIIFHFQGDQLISYECGVAARDEWVKRNGCRASDPDLIMVQGGTCEYYKGCPAAAQVAFCSFEIPPGGDGELPSGHAWSGGSKAGEGAFAAITKTESATELGWHFFKQYAW